MGKSCQSSCANAHTSPVEDRRYRQILWLALIVNAAMFLVEIIAGALSQSLALRADAMDFLSDAANYAITLIVLGLSLRIRASAALFKGLSMAAVGLYVLYSALHHIIAGTIPDPHTMGIIGFLALISNVGVALLLFKFRDGDANRRSIWICSRNDAIGNIAVMAAGGGVWATTTGWPDIIVGLGLAFLGLWGAYEVIQQSLKELKNTQA